MSRRIEIELTSARPDGTWTWRAAGAREPKGVVDGGLIPGGSAVGSVFKADADYEVDGITILSVATTKQKAAPSGLLEILPSSTPFEGVTQQLARRERSDRGDRGDHGDRGGPRRDRGPRRPDGEGGPGGRGPRRDRPARADGAPPTDGGDRAQRGPRPERRQRPNFTPPPELPQRPKAKRLRPGKAHRNAVLADLPEAQRAVAERALQGGIQAVRQAVAEQNVRLKAEGAEEIPAAGLVAMAEQLLPRLRVAEWLDRADAALADLDELDLRDLRSVVAAGEDPVVVRDEAARGLSAQLKAALAAKQEKETALWQEDIDAAVTVGRVVRALKLSSQPPKAGVLFPNELAARLANATNENLSADALPDRWIAVLEAAAFSPVRSLVQPSQKPAQVSDELIATVKRVASLLPQVAALFEIEAPKSGHAPKPLRPSRPGNPKRTGPKPIPAPPAAEKPSKPAAAKATEPESEATTDPESPEATVVTEPEMPVVPDASESPEATVVTEPAATEPSASPAD